MKKTKMKMKKYKVQNEKNYKVQNEKKYKMKK